MFISTDIFNLILEFNTNHYIVYQRVLKEMIEKYECVECFSFSIKNNKFKYANSNYLFCSNFCMNANLFRC